MHTGIQPKRAKYHRGRTKIHETFLGESDALCLGFHHNLQMFDSIRNYWVKLKYRLSCA